jgi:hypothetical protein
MGDELTPLSRARPVEISERKPGRPTLCTPEATAEVARYVTRGLPVKTAARAAGVSVRSINDWLVRGKAGEEPYADFYEAIELAKAEFMAVHVSVIDEAGRTKGNWQASAWLLERRSRAFVKKEQTEAKVEHSGNLVVEIAIPDNGRKLG